MHSGIDDESARAPDFEHKLSELRIGIVVKAHLITEGLGIESPAFHKCSVAAITTKIRNIFLLHRESDLQVMTGHSLVERQRHHLVLRPDLRSVGVDEESAGAGTIR